LKNAQTARRVSRLLSLLIAFLFAVTPIYLHTRAFAQGLASDAIVIEGGTLIDGNGGAPVRDVQIVVQGNRITAIGRKGQAHPQNAQVINADGKFILPGLWDSLDNFIWNQGEILLNNGITSFIGIGDMSEVGVVYAEGIKRGKIRGPRVFDWPVHFVGNGAAGAAGAGNRTGLESPFQSPHALNGPEDARQWTKRLIELGGSGITFQNGGVSEETFKAAVETAHAAGKPVGIRPGGARGNLTARDAALMGADFIPRSNGVAAVVTRAAQDGAANGGNELQQWAEMDDAKAADFIKILVQQKTALIPAFLQKAPGLSGGWSRFELQARRMFSDPALMAYYPLTRAQAMLGNYVDPAAARPNVIEVNMKGYRNALRFHRMLIEAGGRVLIGTDGGNFSLPGLGVHHEMQVFSEDMKLLPMQIIQAATKWPAETMRVQNQIGTVEAGKLADLLIVDEDPLQNVANLQKIAVVIADGKVQPRGFQPWYWSPFGGEGPITIPVVDDLDWVALLRAQRGQRGGERGGQPAGEAGARGLRGGGGFGGRPQPAIETIDSGRNDYGDPDFSRVAVKEGGPTLNLKITGLGYFARSVVYFNEVPVPTRLVNGNQLEARIDESLLRTPGRYPVVVKNAGLADPQKLGDGVSNRGWLIVGYR
jgi:imidazolonepropionase-like amidohydrolase